MMMLSYPRERVKKLKLACIADEESKESEVKQIQRSDSPKPPSLPGKRKVQLGTGLCIDDVHAAVVTGLS